MAKFIDTQILDFSLLLMYMSEASPLIGQILSDGQPFHIWLRCEQAETEGEQEVPKGGACRAHQGEGSDEEAGN